MPGERNVIKATLQTHGVLAIRKLRKQIVVKFKNGQSFQLSVSAEVRPPVTVHPEILHVRGPGSTALVPTSISVVRDLLVDKELDLVDLSLPNCFTVTNRERFADRVVWSLSFCAPRAPVVSQPIEVHVHDGPAVEKILVPVIYDVQPPVKPVPFVYVAAFSRSLDRTKLESVTQRRIRLDGPGDTHPQISGLQLPDELKHFCQWRIERRRDGVQEAVVWLSDLPMKNLIFSTIAINYCTTFGEVGMLPIDVRILIVPDNATQNR
jgi:hypothetical protein